MTERENLIKKIEMLHDSLAQSVSGLSDKQLDTPTGDGKWTIRQIAHHIADANINAYTRMKLVVTEEKPILKPYNQDKWASLSDGRSNPVEQTLFLIKGLHARWAGFLKSLSESDWQREGIHLENGKLTLQDVLRTYSNHGESHKQQIIDFRLKMKW